MKIILRGYGTGMTTLERQNARTEAANLTRNIGTKQLPQPPRGIVVQPAPRGVLVTWNYPAVNFDIQRWRVYRGDENTLYAEIKDRGTRQSFVEATAGASPPTVNIFVSSVNALGIESAKVQIQGKSIAEAGAPTMPTVPPEYNSINSGGRDTSTDYSRVNNR
jgi:hypothetical protein